MYARFVPALLVVLAGGVRPCEAQSCSPLWFHMSAVGPGGGRHAHALAFDAARQRTILFGGRQAGSGLVYGDTWAWDGVAWTMRSGGGGPANPTPRQLHALAFDAARQRVVMFGGSQVSPSAWLGDTWEWDGAAWSLRATAGPSARAGHALAYDSARGVTVLFGGFEGASNRADTWEWNGAAWTARGSAGPGPRSHHAMAYDAARGVTVLFGGLRGLGYSSATLQADTWEWDGAAWVERTVPGPPARAQHAMAFDPLTGRTLLFGGNGSAGTHADTWQWDGQAWTQAQPGSPPPAQAYHSMAADAARGRLVMFGAGATPATWEVVPAAPPAIARPPRPLALYHGQRAVFAVDAPAPLGGGAVAYRWRRNGADLSDGPRISGARSPILILEDAQPGDEGAYDVVVTNACGSTASTPAPLTLLCYANCDQSTQVPILNVQDFSCFLTRFAAGCH